MDANPDVGEGEAQRRATGLIQTRDQLKELNRQQDEAKAKAEELAGAISSSLTSSLRGLIDGSKSAEEALSDAFKGIADAFLDMAMKMIEEWLKMQAIGLIQGLFGGPSPAISPGASAFDLSGGQLNAFADGGRPPLNQPSLVGEEGPELFIPDTAGTIVPNDAFDVARSAMDGGGSKEPADAFAENSQSIAAANSYVRERTLERESTTTTGSSGSIVVETQVINQVEYASVDQLEKATALSAKQARAQMFNDLKNKPSKRAMLGMR